jgi:hypothetical protein
MANLLFFESKGIEIHNIIVIDAVSFLMQVNWLIWVY